LLAQSSRQSLPARAKRAESKREREVESQSERRWQERAAVAGGEGNPAAARAAQLAEARRSAAQQNEDEEAVRERTRLKEAYRALARRFHPDLARTEEDRVKNSRMMARINALYRAGDLDRLLAMAHQAQGAEIEDPELPIEEQVEILSERLKWFEAVFQNLVDERSTIETSPTCEMMRNVEEAERAG